MCFLFQGNASKVGKLDVTSAAYQEIDITLPGAANAFDFCGAAAVGTAVYFVPGVCTSPPRRPHMPCSAAIPSCVYSLTLRHRYMARHTGHLVLSHRHPPLHHKEEAYLRLVAASPTRFLRHSSVRPLSFARATCSPAAGKWLWSWPCQMRIHTTHAPVRALRSARVKMSVAPEAVNRA